MEKAPQTEPRFITTVLVLLAVPFFFFAPEHHLALLVQPLLLADPALAALFIVAIAFVDAPWTRWFTRPEHLTCPALFLADHALAAGRVTRTHLFGIRRLPLPGARGG